MEFLLSGTLGKHKTEYYYHGNQEKERALEEQEKEKGEEAVCTSQRISFVAMYKCPLLIEHTSPCEIHHLFYVWYKLL